MAKSKKSGPPNRTKLGEFVKGASGNPSGRPKGFGAMIRELTEDGGEMVRIAIDIMRGNLTMKVAVKDGVEDIGPSIRDRLAAIQWLADRGFGKAPETVVSIPADSETVRDVLAELSNDALRALVKKK